MECILHIKLFSYRIFRMYKVRICFLRTMCIKMRQKLLQLLQRFCLNENAH